MDEDILFGVISEKEGDSRPGVTGFAPEKQRDMQTSENMPEQAAKQEN